MQTWLFISDEKLPEGFYFSPQKPIVLNLSGNIVFCLKYIGEKVNHPNDYLAYFKKKSDTFYYDYMYPYQIPKVHQSNNRFDQLYPKGKFGVIFHQFSNRVIDLYNERSFDLPVENKTLSVNAEKLRMDFDFLYSDVVVKDDYCQFLYSDNVHSNYYALYDIVNDELLINKKLDYQNIGSNVVFSDFYRIAYYDKKENAVRIISMN